MEITARDANGFASHWKKGNRTGTVERDAAGQVARLVPSLQ
jgi:hypothetical protein